MADLRDYQIDLLARVEAALGANTKARVIMQLPTGGGKTVIAGELLKRRLGRERKAVWLTHRKELAAQTFGMLRDAGVLTQDRPSWPGKAAPARNGGAVILMAQTVGNRAKDPKVWGRYSADDLMVIDETHHAPAKGWERAMAGWPGQVVGMTATPWRLSKVEGFDHLFDEMISGPQVIDLQSDGALCDAKVVVPSSDQLIRGGATRAGEYTEVGIERANSGRDVMTAGALRFWREHASDRQTIVYAVSRDHARNLVRVFMDEGVSAAELLSDTPSENRRWALEAFRKGDVQILVNMQIATEGFDLPDASCVVIIRPTLSLTLFMQMMGRGLRPKDDGDDCLILDLAANSLYHGLPEDQREWTLGSRGTELRGEAPVVRCPGCELVSPASSHNCPECCEPFGKECGRCGKWRAWKSWEFEGHCLDDHEMVCDRCHIDAHVRARLPVSPPLDGLAEIVHKGEVDEGMESPTNIATDDEMDGRLAQALKELLEQEKQIVVRNQKARKEELVQWLQERESLLTNDAAMVTAFDEHLLTLPEKERPQSQFQWSVKMVEWARSLQVELEVWRTERASLEDQPINKGLIFGSAKSKAICVLSTEAEKLEVLPDSGGAPGEPNADTLRDGWHPLSAISDTDGKPVGLRTPSEDELDISITTWTALLIEVAEWLVCNGLIAKEGIRTEAGRSMIIGDVPEHPSGNKFRTAKKLSNGMYLEASINAAEMVRRAAYLVEVTGAPRRFYVQLR